jgi:uncharacterized Ntn-hydrolase superfamily protein
MTWSIAAFDPASGAFAVCVATRALAVGASCPFVQAGVGAVSTQSITNRYLGAAVLSGLSEGLHPEEAVRRALGPDEGRGIRQLHAVDARGRTFAWTGDNCVPWCGSVAAENVSIAGNMLSGEAVIEATREAYLAHAHLDLPSRLLAAMDAGEAAGGDRRGRQSAAMKIVTSEDFPDLDLRVDDHALPLTELRRLVELWREQQAARRGWAPSKANPSGETDLDKIEGRWIAQGLDIRFRR